MLEYTPYVLPFIFSTSILIAISVYAFRLRDRVEIAGLFSLQTLAMAVWTGCYGLELSSPTLEGKVFWAKMKYLGSTTGPVLWFVFSLYYTNRKHWLTTPVRTVLGAFILVTNLVVFTNELHGWYWITIRMEPGFPETLSDQGFFFWIYAVGMYSLILASVIIYFNYYRTVPVYFRRQSILMVIGTFLPLGIRLLEDLVGWDPFPRIDNVILFLLVSAVLYATALFRYSALEIVPIAHSLVVQNINSGILVLDVLGRVVELNPFVKRLLSPESDSSIGQSLEMVLKNGPQIRYSPQMTEQMEEEIAFETGGQERYFIVQVAPIRSERKSVIGHVISLLDITDRKHAEMELERLARTDVLTNITNRRHFFELAELHFETARRYNRPLAIVMLDVDHFKQINDRHGHLVGDLVLQVVAHACEGQVRKMDVFARYGGEEFICLLPEQNDSGALELAERMRRMVAQAEVKADTSDVHVTASFGISSIPGQTTLTLEQLIDQADQALYRSKRGGRNRVTVWRTAQND